MYLTVAVSFEISNFLSGVAKRGVDLHFIILLCPQSW